MDVHTSLYSSNVSHKAQGGFVEKPTPKEDRGSEVRSAAAYSPSAEYISEAENSNRRINGLRRCEDVHTFEPFHAIHPARH